MGQAKKNEETRKTLRRALRVLDLDKRMHHVVLIKASSSLADKRTIERLGNAMAHSDINGLVCVVNDFDDLAVIDELRMLELGWMRVPVESAEQGAIHPVVEAEALSNP